MEPNPGSTQSIWVDSAAVPQYTPLREDARADVCIVGAGIAGLTTAYLAGREGRRVIVLDAGRVGGGETGRTTAHLASAMDDRFTQLEKVHGVDGARLTAESHAAAIDRIESIVREEEIGCGFSRLDGYLFLGPGDGIELLDRELEAARRAGLGDTELLPHAPHASFRTGPCLHFPRQAQLHPIEYIAALARSITRDGGRIHTDSQVLQVEDGVPARVRTAAGATVLAQNVVLATNSPAGHYRTTMKMLPYRTFAVAFDVEDGALAEALYWDTADPYHYVRLHVLDGGTVLIVGGGDYQTGTKDEGEERFDQLERWTRERFPAGGVRRRWSGQVLEPADHLAFIGRDPGTDHLFVATGDSGQGMTHGTIAGMLINDLMAGRPNAWEELYSPTRVKLRAAGEYLADTAKVSIRYLDYLRPAAGGSAEDLSPGEGVVVRKGLKPVAVYRDDRGILHERSAICTHAGCVVRWNSTEKSWDCPCHGSRYDPYGQLLNGPAPAALPHTTDTPETSS